MKNTKLIGGLGAIFVLLSFIPFLGVILGIASVVLLFIAIGKLSSYYNNKEIFYRYLLGFILSVIGSCLFLFFFNIIGFDIFSLLGKFPGSSTKPDIFQSFGGLTVSGFLMFIAAYALSIVGIINWRKSFSLISQLTNVNYFKTSGNLLLWGAVTSILIIGGILLIAAYVVLAVAFFSLPDNM